MKYYTFIRAFQDNVEKIIQDDNARLALLVQQCKGETARVIESCTLMPPEQGYRRAREILKQRFGNELLIADLWIKKLVGQGIRTLILREYADNPRTCHEALLALGSLGELQTQSNLEELIRKVPTYLQNQWRSVVYRLKNGRSPRRPTLRDVVQFVEEAAETASDPIYGTAERGTRMERQPRKASTCHYNGRDMPRNVGERPRNH